MLQKALSQARKAKEKPSGTLIKKLSVSRMAWLIPHGLGDASVVNISGKQTTKWKTQM